MYKYRLETRSICSSISTIQVTYNFNPSRTFASAISTTTVPPQSQSATRDSCPNSSKNVPSQIWHPPQPVHCKSKKMRIVVHEEGDAWQNGMSDNHWSIFLVLAGNQGSVRMNMSATAEDTTGNLYWSAFGYAISNSAITHWDLPTTGPVTSPKYTSQSWVVVEIALLCQEEAQDAVGGCEYHCC